MDKITQKELKDLGLQGLEDISKQSVNLIFKAIEVIIKNSENKIDDAFLPFLMLIKEKILILVDQIKQDKE